MASVALLGIALSTGAAAAKPSPVTVNNFPTIAEAAKAYPFLEGGSRDVWNGGPQVDVLGKDCVSYDTASVTAVAGRVGGYLLEDDSYPYFSGYADPGSRVFKFSTPAKATQAYKQVRNAAQACIGRHVSGGYGDEYHKLRVPATIGDQRFALRNISYDAHTGRDWNIMFTIRHGKFLIDIEIQKDYLPAPSTTAAARFARSAVEVAP